MSKPREIVFGFQSLIEQYILQRRRVAGERTALDELKAKIADLATRYPGKTQFFAAKSPNYYVCVNFRDKKTTDWSAVIDELVERFNIDDETLRATIRRHTQVAELMPHVGPPTFIDPEA